MKVFKVFYSIKKEEDWLASMAKKGWLLVKKTSHYHFLATTHDNIIKIDYRSFKKNEDFIDYKNLYEDSGWQHVAGSKNSGKQYFLKKYDASEDIFSDNASKLSMKLRYLKYWTNFSLIAMVYLAVLKPFDYKFSLDKLFLTPDLWTLKGGSFVFAFLFEAPFAFFRLLTQYGAFFFAILLMIGLVKQKQLLKQKEKSTISQI